MRFNVAKLLRKAGDNKIAVRGHAYPVAIAKKIGALFLQVKTSINSEIKTLTLNLTLDNQNSPVLSPSSHITLTTLNKTGFFAVEM